MLPGWCQKSSFLTIFLTVQTSLGMSIILWWWRVGFLIQTWNGDFCWCLTECSGSKCWQKFPITNDPWSYLTRIIKITACRPKLSELQRYVKPFAASQWEELGTALGLADEDDGQLLSEIESKKGENEGKCFMKVVTVWLRGKGVSPKTWGTLLHCLEETEMHQAVRSIQENILKCKLS